MKPPLLVSRRRFILTASAAAAAAIAGCSGASADRKLVFASFDEALRELDLLAGAKAPTHTGAFNLAQTLVHCAQSIEYSLSGYPQAKSAAFQHTAGALAFSFFSARGRMSHDLGEPIPGAPALDAQLATLVAAARLRQAIGDFKTSAQPLRPHFAYGSLSRAEYTNAHLMHLANHFSSFSAAA